MSKRVPLMIVAGLLPLSAIFPQRNNPFSSNPDVHTTIASAKPVEPPPVEVRTGLVANDASTFGTSADLTKIYKIGAGDTLYIVLANAPNASGFYSVRADGTIDFPLAGTEARVSGMTAADIQKMLATRIKLYADARLQVSVREFASHKINVTGLVERNGERFLQREAMPLYTVKSDVGVQPSAARVLIHRSNGASETYDLRNQNTDDVLISAGDLIEFR